MLTVNQRDMLALYCLKEGIRSESNVKKQLQEYEIIRGIVGKLAEELANVQEEKIGTAIKSFNGTDKRTRSEDFE